MTFFDRRVNRKRIKLMFGMKMIEKNSPDFFSFSFAFEKEDSSG